MRIFFLSLLFLPMLCRAQSPVTHSAGAGENVPSLACLACVGAEWNAEFNIAAEDDAVASTVLNPAGNCFQSICSHSRFLYAHHFNFSIPSDATIDTILVDIKRASKETDAVSDSIVQLERNGIMIGHNLKLSSLWPSSLSYASYGHLDPLWGAVWIPSELNDTTMGVALKVINHTAQNVMADVDHIRMTVYYSTSTGTYSITSSPSVIEWKNAPGEIAMNIFTSSPVNCLGNIFNTTGQQVASFNFGRSLSGWNHFHFSMASLSSGLYFVMMNVGQNYFSKKLWVPE